MGSARRSRFSVRGLSRLSTVLVGLLVVSFAAGVVWTSALVSRSIAHIERASSARLLTGDVERTLREHQRLGNLVVATGDPQRARESAALAADLRATLRETARRSDGTVDAREIERTSEAIDAYLSERAALDARRLPLESIAAEINPVFERALESSAKLREQAEHGLSRALSRADRALGVQTILALVFMVCLAGVLLSVGIGVRRLVLQPVFELRDAIRRFRGDAMDARARVGPARELADLSTAFNEMADTIAREKDDRLRFLAGVAHDLRNPLFALKIGLDVIERIPAAADVGRVQQLGRQVDRLARMVDDLLDATRIEAGRLELQRSEFDLRDAARTMIDLYASTTDVHDLRLKGAETPVIVRVDRHRIEQVIGNLLSNAIKYSPSGGLVEVSVTCDASRAELTVADHGVGIHPDDMPRLFAPFQRRRAGTDNVAGAGLGLSIVRRIVDAHGGAIDVDSTPGVGTTFRVHLPLSRPCAREDAQAT